MNKLAFLFLILVLVPGVHADTIIKEQGGSAAFFTMLAFAAATFILAIKLGYPVLGVISGFLIILASAYGILSVFSGLANAFCALVGVVGIILSVKSAEELG